MRTSQSLVNAQREADRMMESLAQRREVMLRQLHDMQSRLLAVADDLETAIRPPALPPPAPPTASAPAAPAVPVGDELGSPVAPNAAPPSAPGPEPSASTPIEDLWVASGAAPAKAPAAAGDEVGLSELFDPPAGDVDLPDLSDLDLDLDIDADDGR
jgi:hypothetical protein